MASMAFDGDVRKNLLDRTDAEKVFRSSILTHMQATSNFADKT